MDITVLMIIKLRLYTPPLMHHPLTKSGLRFEDLGNCRVEEIRENLGKNFRFF